MIFSGTTDAAVPTRGTKKWIGDLGWEVIERWRPYFYKDQLAGHLERYQGGLTFATIHGTGHMAPQWEPEESYYVIFNWLFNRTI